MKQTMPAINIETQTRLIDLCIKSKHRLKFKQMKKILYILLLSLPMVACNDDFLDREPLDRISSESVFNDPALVEAYLFQTYNYLQNGFGYLDWTLEGQETVGYTDQGAFTIDCLSDCMTNKSAWPRSNAIIIPGQIFPSSTLEGLDIWERAYTNIRLTNSIIYNLENSELSADYKARIASEARFIRALNYFELVKRYGDVPLIKELQSLDNMEDLLVARDKAEDIYLFIDEEFTEAAEILPSVIDMSQDEMGRATKEACWALNGRAQLYAKNYTRSAELSTQVIASNNYSLSPDYNALFQSYGGDNEVIFEIMFNGADKGHAFDLMAYPFSHRSDWGSQYLPTQELVESYEMTNGLAISDPSSGYDPQNPFANRDSRLQASVLYHGNDFKGEPILVALSSDNAVLAHDIDAPGLTGNHTTTGYYMKKYLDESLADSPEEKTGKTSWKEIRLAEVLLNYAEAQNEAVGPDQSVYDAINEVRARVQQPELPSGLSKEEMFERIVQERKVELFAEGFRYWDLRRWELAIDVLHNKKAHGMYITKDANNPENLTYEVVEAPNRPTYVFLEHFYLLPLPQDEIDKNPNLVQNPGY